MSQQQIIKDELSKWFFDVYFNHWVEVASGVRKEGPDFILKYWGTPMYACAPPRLRAWLTTDADVVKFLEMNHIPLKEQGYTHTVIPDRKIIVYNEHGGAIEVIWSRRRADDSEIERAAVHFEVARLDREWKVVGVQVKLTREDTLDKAWAE